jgi:hypothetical protein
VIADFFYADAGLFVRLARLWRAGCTAAEDDARLPSKKSTAFR